MEEARTERQRSRVTEMVTETVSESETRFSHPQIFDLDVVRDLQH